MFVERTVVIENIDGLEVVLLTEHIVVYIVCRGHLQGTGTELDINIFIPNHRNRTSYQRHNHPRIFGKMLITGIVWVDTQRRISQNGLRTGCRYNHILVSTLDTITQIIKFTLRFAVDHLFVRQSRQRRRVPIDHTHPAIDLAFIIQIDKYLDDAAGHLGIHRKFRPIPITRSSQTTQLTENNATMFLFPLPGVFEELFTGQRVFVNSLLSRNRRMVRTRHPAGVLSLHPRTTHQNILNRFVQHMPHVQYARHIGGRNNNGIGLPIVRNRMEKSMLHPVIVPLLLDLLRSIFGRNFHNICYLQVILLFLVKASVRKTPQRQSSKPRNRKIPIYRPASFSLPICQI